MLTKRGISCFLRAITFPVFRFTRQVHLGFILFIMRGRQHQNLKAQCKDLQVVCNFYLRLENSFTFFYGFFPYARISPISTFTSIGMISGKKYVLPTYPTNANVTVTFQEELNRVTSQYYFCNLNDLQLQLVENTILK